MSSNRKIFRSPQDPSKKMNFSNQLHSQLLHFCRNHWATQVAYKFLFFLACHLCIFLIISMVNFNLTSQIWLVKLKTLFIITTLVWSGSTGYWIRWSMVRFLFKIFFFWILGLGKNWNFFEKKSQLYPDSIVDHQMRIRCSTARPQCFL